MTESEREEHRVAEITQRVMQGIQLLFQQGFAAGVGAHIDKGEAEAIRLGTLAGIACLTGLDAANLEATPHTKAKLESCMDQMFGTTPKVELAPASALQRNGKLAHH